MSIHSNRAMKMNDTHNSRDKRRPMEERVAAMMGRGSYVDIRQGLGGTSASSITNQDIAAALGMVNTRCGRKASMVLETHYGSSLLHLDTLLRAWEESQPAAVRTRELIVLHRFGGELAIRQLAGVKYSSPELARYAYLIFSRRENLQIQVDAAYQWLTEIRDEALFILRETLLDPVFWEERRRPLKAKA